MNSRLTDTHRESLVAVLGAPPEMCSLEPEILSTETIDGYLRQRVSYCVSPNERVTSYVLSPIQQDAPAPAMVCHHRHGQDWDTGKSEVIGISGDPNEALAVELVKRGYVVLAPDALAFEDRRPNKSASYENNFQELAARLLRGETLLRKGIWDISRGIDYLEALPEVNEESIGFIGHGYGSLMAAWVMALDMRVKAAVGHRHWTSMHEMLRRKIPIQMEFAVPRLLQVADYDWILGLIAPRPFLISTLASDPTCLDARLIYEKARVIYDRFEVSDHLSFYEYESDGASDILYPPEAREYAYTWLDSWLRKDDSGEV